MTILAVIRPVCLLLLVSLAACCQSMLPLGLSEPGTIDLR